MKKLVAILLAAVMVMALAGTALAVTQDTTHKGTLTITGLENGDTVSLYRVIGWDSDTGNWYVESAYNGISDNAAGFETIDAAKAAEIAKVAANAVVTDGTTSGGTFTTEQPVGMYLALVKTSTSTVYNPMILSVNWNEGAGVDSSLAADTASLSSVEAVAKKTPITLTKEVNADSTDLTSLSRTVGDTAKGVKVGDYVPYTVSTVIPTYADKDRDLKFVVTDTLSDGLTLDASSIVVTVGGTALTAGTEYTLSTNANGYTITFSQAYLRADKASHDVAINYRAQINERAVMHNVERYNNEVKLDFTNGPTNESSNLTSETNHYTFSLDASAIGNNGGKNVTSELVKIGIDSHGEVITKWQTSNAESWESVNPLAGATFTLVGEGVNATTTSNAAGQISFYGLDAGTYTLTETKAPDGYVKESGSHRVVITATYGGTNGDELQSYTVTIDDSASTYQISNDATNKNTVTFASIDNSNTTFPIVNTKGLELPTTGGIGTTIFYAAGLVLILGAAAVLVARRKADAE